MNCPECGAENSDDALYCSLCLRELKVVKGAGVPPGAHSTSVEPEAGFATWVPPTGKYTPPSEWRGDAVTVRVEPYQQVERRVRRLEVAWFIYGALIAAIAIFIILCLTVWGNPSPAEVAGKFVQALNQRDRVEMKKYISPGQASTADHKLEELLGQLGEGTFQRLSYEVRKESPYNVQVRIKGGVFSPGGARMDVTIDYDDNLYIGMNSLKGKWYIDVNEIHIVP